MGACATVAVRVGRLADALGADGLQAMTEAAAFEVKNQALRRLVLTVGGDRRMARFGGRRSRGRVRGGVGYDYLGAGRAVVKYRPAGFWQLLEFGAAPHDAGVDRRGRPLVAAFPDGTRAVGPFRHPGTRPKRVLTRARDEAARTVPDKVTQAAYDVAARLMDG